jgi:hypothetical protein
VLLAYNQFVFQASIKDMEKDDEIIPCSDTDTDSATATDASDDGGFALTRRTR